MSEPRQFPTLPGDRDPALLFDFSFLFGGLSTLWTDLLTGRLAGWLADYSIGGMERTSLSLTDSRRKRQDLLVPC